MFFLMADIVAMGMVRDYYSDVWAIAKLCRNVKKIFFSTAPHTISLPPLLVIVTPALQEHHDRRCGSAWVLR